MPKVIENLKEQLLAEAKKQVFERGYAQTTIRSIAGACGVGVGTVYNYFKSKEILVATFVFEEWKNSLREMSALSCDEPKAFLQGIHCALKEFSTRNEKLFVDPEATKLVSASFSARHKLLRSQISAFILPLCEKNQVENAQFTAEFLAESIICWTMENMDFEVMWPLLEKIIQ